MYDVFLSYNRKDRELAEKVEALLIERGLDVFLDRSSLRPGIVWSTEVEAALNKSRSVAVLVGPNRIGPIQQHEKGWALNRQTYDPSFPVIPVLLPDADPKLGFLGQNTWIDLRGGFFPELIEALVLGIRGKPPGHDLKARAAELFEAVRPYRGLVSFDEEDEPFFFGREDTTKELIDAVETRNLVAVVGASGSGKSSVVRAGLIPHLRRIRNPNAVGRWAWEIATFAPKERPLYFLADCLVPLLGSSKSDFDEVEETEKWARGFTREIKLRSLIDKVLAKQTGTDRLLLFVDQFEEIYSPSVSEAERQTFIDQLLDASTSRSAVVVLTLRGDFYDKALSYREFSDRLKGGVVNVGPMTSEELKRAIEEPAKKVALEFEDGLVNRILVDTAQGPGQLPLVEFLLFQLWEKREGNLLRHKVYEAIGGVKGAIADRADTVLGRLPKDEQEAARWSLLKLVTPNTGTDDTRRRAEMADFDAVGRDVVDKLTEARLLVRTRDKDGREWVEVGHEALIREWKKLRGWVDENRAELQSEQRLEEEANIWEKNGRKEYDLLPSGRKLDEARLIFNSRPETLKPLLRTYLDLSLAAEKARQAELERAERERAEQERTIAIERAEKAEAARRAARRLAVHTGIFGIAASVLLIVASVLAIMAYRAEQVASHEADNAKEAQQVASTEAEKAKRAEQLASEEAKRSEANFQAAVATTKQLLDYVKKNVNTGRISNEAAREVLKNADDLIAKLQENDQSPAASRQIVRYKLEMLWAISDVLVDMGDAKEGLVKALAAEALANEISAAEPGSTDALRFMFLGAFRVGDAYDKLGDYDRAQSEFQIAMVNADARAAKLPDDEETQSIRTFMRNSIGNLLYIRGDLDGALRQHQDALAIIEPLARNAPKVKDWQFHLASTRTWLGFVYRLRREFDAALEQFGEALAIRRALVAAEPESRSTRSNVAGALAQIGETLLLRGDPAGALVSFNEAFGIREALFNQDPTNADSRGSYASSLNNIGDVWRMQGNLSGALDQYREAFKIRLALAQLNASNVNWQDYLAAAYTRLGDMLAPDDPAGALKNYQSALAIVAPLAPKHDKNASPARSLYVNQTRIGDTLAKLGSVDDALKSYRDAMQTAELLAPKRPVMGLFQVSLLFASNRAAALLLKQGDGDGALAALRRAIELAQILGASVPRSIGGPRDLIESWLGFAEVLLDRNQLAEALNAYNAARGELTDLSDATPEKPALRARADAFGEKIKLLDVSNTAPAPATVPQ